jgi:phosphatidylinositol phospholipase C beta
VVYDRPAEAAQEPAVRRVVQEQMAQWSEMVERHRKEEWEALKQQVTDNQELLRKLMERVQGEQMKTLEAKHER